MVIRPLTIELQEKAKNELGEEPSCIVDNLGNIRQWLLTQHHLQCRTDDQWLTSFLRGSKFDMEKAKTKIDNFYRMRTLVPEVFKNRDPFQPEIQEFLKAGFYLPLPLTSGESGPRIIYTHFNGISNTKLNLILLLKVYCMIADVMLLEDDNLIVGGFIGWADCAAFPYSYLLQVTPNLLRKLVYCLQYCYPVRIKEIHLLNTPLGSETFIKLMKTFMSGKVKNRFFVYGKRTSKELENILDKKYMPQHHGGMNGCTDDLIEYWKNKIESYRDWFLEDDKYCSDENLRPQKLTGALNFLSSFNPFK